MLRHCALPLLLLACNQSKPAPAAAPAPTEPACDAVAARMRVSLVEQLHDAGSAGLAMVDRMLGALTTACTEDRWPASVRACIVESKDRAALDACQAQLPNDQRQKLGERLRPIIAPTTTN